MIFVMYIPRLVEFGVVRRWSPVSGVVNDVSLQAPFGGVILTKIKYYFLKRPLFLAFDLDLERTCKI